MSALESLFRWGHVFAGIIWIGLLYWFNFVNTAFAPTMDADAKKKVVPELMPRTLFWFRWGAAWTWITGVVLLLLVFYHGRAAWEGDSSIFGSIVMILVTFLAVFAYDALWKTGVGKDLKTGGAVSFIILAVIVFLFDKFAGFGYRGTVIHTGAMFGTIMAFNVWYRIWPAQQKVLTAVKKGEAPDAAVVALAGARSKHNTYLSVPLIWAMINTHTTAFAGGKWGLSGGTAWIGLLIFTLIGWAVVFWCYKKAASLKGW